MTRWTFTSESVTEGHPDKMADQISDAVLDALIAQDPQSRVACETLLTTGLVVVAGEITTTGYVEIPKLVREVVTDIGYTSSQMGFDGSTCGVAISIGAQSPDIAQGVDTALEVRAGTSGEDILNAQGAGDQGMMFGYACDETDDLMPMPIWLAHRLAQRLAQVRKAGVLPYLRPDGKTQVTFEYEDGRPVRLRTVLISTQHNPNIDLETLLLPDLRDHVITPLIPGQFADDGYQVLANPTGKFELGGPHADAGLTGRKIIVDTYGGAARHGGGAFSGEGSVQGRPFGRLRRPLAGQARGGVRRRQPVRDPGGLRHRRGPAGVAAGRDLRHRHGRSGPDREGHRRGLRPAPGGDHPRPRPAPAHLPQDRRLRPLRPLRQGVQLGAGEPAGRVHLGAGGLVHEVKTGGRRRAGPAALPEPGALVGRVVTDVAGVDKEFDYLVPAAAGRRRPDRDPGAGRPGRPAGRRLGGPPRRRRRPGAAPPADRQGSRVGSRSGGGGPGRLGGLAVGRPARALLATASAERAVPVLPAPACQPPAPPPPTGLTAALPVDGPVTLRLPPAADATPVVAELAQRGPTLVVVPSVRRGAVLAGRLRRAGGDVAVMPEDWAQARAGAAVVVGARAAAWAPCPGLAAVVVIDGHDQRLIQEQAPTWSAVTVAAERARRAGGPVRRRQCLPDRGAAGRGAAPAGRPPPRTTGLGAARGGRPPPGRSPAGPVLRASGGAHPDRAAGGVRAQPDRSGSAAGVRLVRGGGPLRAVRRRAGPDADDQTPSRCAARAAVSAGPTCAPGAGPPGCASCGSA